MQTHTRARKAKKSTKRPYKTLYFANDKDLTATYANAGCAASDRGAIRASVVRIFMGEYAKAMIFDRALGIPLYTIRHGATGLQIEYGRGVTQAPNLYRIR